MTTLLDADGKPSVATALMMSHHAFRRDLACFVRAFSRPALVEDPQEIQAEWQNFRGALHGHHEHEDKNMFPMFKEQVPALADVFERLSADHRKIDPLLERGDAAFANLASPTTAAAVVSELKALLDEHLAVEEEAIVPLLRKMTVFPPPTTDAELDMYAQGFAWSSHGVAPEVLEKVNAMLPPGLVSRLPAARAAFAARWQKAWGAMKVGPSNTSVPVLPPE